MAFNYRPVLDQAIAAAREAGDLLRVDLHRPDGARGHGSKADADTEAERLIRARLESAFPLFGFVGEETQPHTTPRDEEKHCWLVDPNDGTRDYIKGYRGSAVSIGLVRNGAPVLGVIFAFSYPDDRGDFFAWAEGCGPLMRNGKPIGPLPERTLDSTCIVNVSLGSDRRSRGNARVVAPARFRATASIAYRLALAAAGEGQAGVSLGGPQDWDFAAGHALLRGVGGEVYSPNGKPIVYSPEGRHGSCDCVGGEKTVAWKMALRNWEGAMRKEDAAETYPLTTPERGALITDPDLLSRAQGCWLGQLAGDSLGGLVEFQSLSEIHSAHPGGVRLLRDGGTWNTLAGQPTDDSELALMLARAIVQEGNYATEAVARAYAYWIDSGPFDIGGTTRAALAPASAALRAGEPVARAARRGANLESQANGALMRISPLGIFGHALPPDRVAEMARADASLTHPHRVCQDANAVFAVAISHAIASGADARGVYAFATEFAKKSGIDEAILAALEMAESAAPAFAPKIGWVQIAFQNAFHQMLHAPNLEEGIVRTVMGGGDTDTNAAIAGALLGAVHGRDAVPLQWRQMILTCRPIREFEGIHRPRPKPFWPVDAMMLAERLLILGKRAI